MGSSKLFRNTFITIVLYFTFVPIIIVTMVTINAYSEYMHTVHGAKYSCNRMIENHVLPDGPIMRVCPDPPSPSNADVHTYQVGL